MKPGDLVSYRRVDVKASFEAPHRRGVHVVDHGLVIKVSTKRALGDGDYLIRVYLPSHPCRIRTMRASRVEKIFSNC